MILFASLMNLGGPDLIVILLIVLVLFGSKRLPDLARGIGQAMKEFQKAKDDLHHELRPVAATDENMNAAKPGMNEADAIAIRPGLASTTQSN